MKIVKRYEEAPTTSGFRIVEFEGRQLVAMDAFVIDENGQGNITALDGSCVLGNIEKFGGTKQTVETLASKRIGKELPHLQMVVVEVEPYKWLNPTTGVEETRNTSRRLVARKKVVAVEGELTPDESTLNVDVDVD